MARFTYIPNRVIDSDGISDGATITFYQAGTTTPITVYSDAGLTTPVSNPYTVAAGAAVPPLYWSFSGGVRVLVKDTAGATISDDDPWTIAAADSGYSSVANLQSAAASDGLTAYLTDTSRAGTFVFDSSNLSSQVTLDTQQGIYIAPSSDATGASGAWVRQYDGNISLDWFGVDGTRTNDSLAIKGAIAVAAGAPIELKPKRYYWDSSLTFSTDLCLHGSQMPRLNAGKTALEDGTIIDGEFSFTATNVELRDMGFDVGSDSTAPDKGDGCRGTATLNAGGRLHTENIIGLCQSRTHVGHALLFQSYQRHTGTNLLGVYSLFGVVLKNQNVTLGLVRSLENNNSGVLLKSDTGFGRLQDVHIEHVEALGFTGQDNGFHIQSEDNNVRRVSIGSIKTTLCEIGVHLQCGASGIELRDIQIGRILSEEAFTNDLVLDADSASSAIFNVQIGNLVTRETKSASVVTKGSGDTQNLTIDNAFINYRSAATQTDMDNAVFFGTNTIYSTIGHIDVVRNYFDTIRGKLTYSAGNHKLGSRRAKVAGAGSPLATVYNTTGGTAINIDIANAERVTIVINTLSLSTTDKIEWQLSTDDGTTLETGSVYKRARIDHLAADASAATSEFWSVINNSPNFIFGKIELVGHDLPHPTLWDGFAGSITDNEARMVSGVVNTTSEYKTLQLQAPTGTFDAVDIVVYKH